MAGGGKSGGKGGRTGRGSKGARGGPLGPGGGFGQSDSGTGAGRGAHGPESGSDAQEQAENCVCPKCGHRERPVPGRACNKRKCPKCRSLMARDEVKAD